MRFSEFFVIHHSDRKVLTFLLALATILVVLIYLTGNDGGETVLTAADSLAAEEQPGYGKGRRLCTPRSVRALPPPAMQTVCRQAGSRRRCRCRAPVPHIAYASCHRDVRSRDRLGGFYNVSQLRDLDGFPAEALPFLTLRGEKITKLNINQLSLSQLRKHPYINYFQAKAICDYRRLKGPLHSLDQLRLLQKDFPPEAINRLRHYVTF